MSEAWYETPGDATYPEGPGDGPALDQWDNLPPHLREALDRALQGLRDAYLDVDHPLLPQMQAIWEVAEQIEAWLLTQGEESSEVSE